MKRLPQLCAAAVLTLALSLTAFAGEIGTGATPPKPTSVTDTVTVGEVTTGAAASESTLDGETETTLPLTEAAWLALQSLMSLL